MWIKRGTIKSKVNRNNSIYWKIQKTWKILLKLEQIKDGEL